MNTIDIKTKGKNKAIRVTLDDNVTPNRRGRFKQCLRRRAADQTKVIRRLVDKYIDSNGLILKTKKI